MLTERDLQPRTLVRVPDIVGLPLRKALLLITHAGLRVGARLYKESYEEKDTVLEQRPLRGQMVYTGEEVTLWISREGYIKWLPAIYQRSDATGRNIVRDLLWIVQHLFGSIESQLDSIHQYFDSYETREDFLPWLAAWSAMVLETDWPVNKKRRLIKKAMELYRWRGTVKGLKLFIALFTGFEPYIQENVWPYQGLRIGVSSSVGIDTVILPPVDKSHAFLCVMPHQFRDVSPESIIRLHEIIEMEKPAHSHYMLKFEEPRLSFEERAFYRIGVSSGVNIGDEVVTPLPVNPETGEAEVPKEAEMPPPIPDPSVYELFGTKKRQLPPILGAPKADNAPVEGKEITSSKFGFEGAREFKLDDIMRELLERAGVSTDGMDIGSLTGQPTRPETTPAVVGTAEVEGHVKGRGPQIDIEIDAKIVDREEVVTTDGSPAPGTTAAATATTTMEAAKQAGKLEPIRSLHELETLKLGGAALSAPETVKLDRAQVQIEEIGLRKGNLPRITVALDIEGEKPAAEAAKTDGTARPPENDSKK